MARAFRPTKACSRCRERKFLDQFSTGRAQCRACRSADARRYQAERCEDDKRASRKAARLAQYGLTAERYDALRSQQNDECAICHRLLGDTDHIDHDHKCCGAGGSCGGCVRGLLCPACNNKVLGGCDDNVEILRSAIAYLERSR